MTAIFQLDWYPNVSAREVLWQKYSCCPTIRFFHGAFWILILEAIIIFHHWPGKMIKVQLSIVPCFHKLLISFSLLFYLLSTILTKQSNKKIGGLSQAGDSGNLSLGSLKEAPWPKPFHRYRRHLSSLWKKQESDYSHSSTSFLVETSSG